MGTRYRNYTSYGRKWCTRGIEEVSVSGWNGSATNGGKDGIEGVIVGQERIQRVERHARDLERELGWVE